MSPLANARSTLWEAVQHAADGGLGTTPRARSPGSPCARCGAPAASRPGSRYCSARCRQRAVRERRAQARADLLVALALARDAADRISRALAALGLNPVRPRRRKEPPCPAKT